VEEIEMLAASGANELYCGIVPSQWIGNFRAPTANRRLSGNLRTYDDLRRAIVSAHEQKCQISLVLNAQQYDGEQISAAIDLGKRFHDLGGDALIVCDVGLINAISDALPDVRIHVSSVASCRNTEAAQAYRDLGAKRIILPRDITLAEAERIVRAVPDIEIEVFILNDGCVFEEGSCHTIHLPGQLGGPICLDNYTHEYHRRDGRSLKAQEIIRLNENDRDYKQWLWYRFSCGFSVTQDGLPYGPCGLCAIPMLHSIGATAIKIASREAPTERKVASTQMVRSVLDCVERGAGVEEAQNFARHYRGDLKHCRTGYMCYYPEVALPAQHKNILNQA
jgi:hypothetical protein